MPTKLIAVAKSIPSVVYIALPVLIGVAILSRVLAHDTTGELQTAVEVGCYAMTISVAGALALGALIGRYVPSQAAKLAPGAISAYGFLALPVLWAATILVAAKIWS